MRISFFFTLICYTTLNKNSLTVVGDAQNVQKSENVSRALVKRI